MWIKNDIPLYKRLYFFLLKMMLDMQERVRILPLILTTTLQDLCSGRDFNNLEYMWANSYLGLCTKGQIG